MLWRMMTVATTLWRMTAPSRIWFVFYTYSALTA
jgi:hypothetical protein